MTIAIAFLGRFLFDFRRSRPEMGSDLERGLLSAPFIWLLRIAFVWIRSAV